MRPHVTSFLAAVSLATLTALHAPGSALGAPKAAGPKKPDAAKIAEAKRHMSAGAAFYNDPSGHKCEEALREFNKAYELSGSLNALKGMAVCNLELERDGEAIEQYTKVLEGKGNQLDAAERQQIETDLSTLKAAVVYITFTSDNPSAGFRLTDVRTPSRGYPVTNRYELPQGGQTLGIHPGLHTFTASAEGKPDQVWKIEIANGSKHEHTFEFDKPVIAEEPTKKAPSSGEQDQPLTTRPVPAAVYAVGGLSLAALGTTIGLMVWAKGKNTDYAAKNGRAPTAELKELQAGVKTANLIADIGLGVTLVSMAATTALYLTRPTKRVEPKASSWVVAPVLGPAGGGAVMTGAF